MYPIIAWIVFYELYFFNCILWTFCLKSTEYVRFSDDTAMLALLSDFASYQSYVSSVVCFSSWCSNNFLHLNVFKTKQMCIDFHRNRTVNGPIVINGEPVEKVDSFKYHGVILDEKLSFTKHVTAVQKKSQQRLHVLRKLRAFYVDPLLLLRLYRSIIEPLITYCSICYYPALSVKNVTGFWKSHTFPPRSLAYLHHTNTLRNNRPCNFEESSCCRYWVWSPALYVLPCISVPKEIPLYKM